MKIRITTGAILDATPSGWYTETRPADEDAERLVNLLCGIAGATWPLTSRADAIWLRETLLGWLNSLLYRGALLGYNNESPTAVRDALAELQL